jgi:hypothetical protein
MPLPPKDFDFILNYNVAEQTNEATQLEFDFAPQPVKTPFDSYVLDGQEEQEEQEDQENG